MEKHTYFKYCLVPLCNSTTAKTPNKVFIRLPFDRNRRTKWLEACRKEVRDVSPNSSALHVCEDHFNLENDMENYLRWKLMGGHKLMKSDAVPHKFECQALKVVGKKKRIQETEDALSASTSINISTLENSSSNVNDTIEQPQQCEAVDSPQNTNLDTTNLSASSDSTESTDSEHDFGVNELKNKIKNIRSTYQQEVNKIRRSKQGFRGDILEEYKTNLAWFPIADRFLGTVINSTKNPLPKTEEEDASFYHSNQPALYNLVETEMNGEIDSEIDVKYQPFTISLDQIKEEIDIDDYNSPSVTHQLKKRKSSHQSAYEAIDQTSRTESDTQIHNPMEDIQKDEWYHFGNNIACQLRNLSLERALMCQQKIIEILTQERIDFITKMKTEDANTTKED